MSKYDVKLKKENIKFSGNTEEEKKLNEAIYGLTLEIDSLQKENEELKKINASLQSALSLSRQKYNNDKQRYRRKYKKEHNILIEFEKWLEQKEKDTKINPVMSGTIKGVLDKLQELKEGNK